MPQREPLAATGSLHYTADGAALALGSLPGEPTQRRQILNPCIEEAIVIPDRKAVRAYLKRHADLAANLPAVCEAARKEFGSEAELSLELYRDPEIRDHYLTLYVLLRAP